jgi:protein TonB
MTPTTMFSAAVSATGILSSLLLFNRHSPTERAIPVEVVRIDDIPQLPPEPPEVKKSDDPAQDEDDVVKVPYAPPSLIDVPPISRDPMFTEDVTPPPPPGIPTVPGLVTIPSGSPSLHHEIGKIFDPSQLERVPVAKTQMEPNYPYEMKRDGVEGEVTVCFIVDVNGDVLAPYAAASTRREFEAPAVQAVSKWKFKPGWKGGRAVNTRMSVPLVFRIEK